MASPVQPVMKTVTESWMFTHRSWIGGALLGPATVAAVFAKPIISEGPGLALLFDSIGWFFFVAYVSIRIWATLYVGGVKDRELQTRGPYSVTRNPLYLGSLCFAFSICFFLQSLTLVVLTLAASWAYVRWVIPAEEEVLGNIFGEQFREYKLRTPRLIPRPSLYAAAPTVEVRLRPLRTEAKRLIIASLVLVLVFGLPHFQAAAWWPRYFMWV